MKKKKLLLGALLLVSGLGFAQTTIPNGAFETWDNVGGTDEEPVNWSSNKTGSGFASLGPQTCYRETTNPHSGTYCLKLENGSFFGTPINASATTGQIQAPSTNPLDGYISTVTANPDFNSPFTGRPDSLVGWYRFNQGSADVARITAVLHDNYDFEEPDQGASASHKIADLVLDLPTTTQTTWTRFAIKFDYAAGAIGSATPTHILLIATASNSPGSANAGTILWLDDLQAIYNPVCAETVSSITESVCDSYTTPSGKIWTNTVVENDTIPNAAGCDSVITINLTVTDTPTAGTSGATNVTDCLNPDGTITVSGATGGVTYELFIAGGATTGMTNGTGVFNGLNAGNYEVVVSDNSCTSTTNSATINNGSAPAAPNGSGDDTYCEGSTIADLTASGTGGTLTWYLGGSSVGTGGTISPNTTAGTHTYSVTETVSNCESAPTVLVVEISESPVISNNSSSAVDSCNVDHGTISVAASPSEGYELFDDNSASVATNMTGDFDGLPAGDYTVEITNEACTVIENVTIDDNTGDHTVDIVPLATQTINESTDGDELTSTESSNAEDREWLFTTTSGTGYQSFATAEVSVTYTPNFTTAGTYYVICESTINNCMVSSDEVQINVGDIGISELDFDETYIIFFNNELMIDLTSVKADKASYEVLSIDGKLMMNDKLITGLKNSKTIDLVEGIYIVNVLFNGQSITKKIYTK